MGGVSTGKMTLLTEDGQPFARMTGRVSTANRGGFIQMRRGLPADLPAATTGLRLVVRGNGQRYFVHLRTIGAPAPWHFHQAGFDTGPGWRTLDLPLTAFTPSGGGAAGPPAAQTVTSVAIAAYGRDYEAGIDLREIAFG
jgi:hypothetical protein